MKNKKNILDKDYRFLPLISYLSILFLIPLLWKKKNDFVRHHVIEGMRLFICENLSYLFVFIIGIFDLAQRNIKYYKFSLINNINNVSAYVIYLFCFVLIFFGIIRIIGMIKVLRSSTNKSHILDKYIVIFKAALIITSMFLLLPIINSCISLFIKNSTLSGIIANIIYLILLALYFRKDIKKEFKVLISDFKNIVNISFKFYFLGLGIMIFSNLIINRFLGGISTNETLVREIIFNTPFYAFISVSILAPIIEELVFRKSLKDIFKNKWLYASTCGLLFGLAHIITLNPTWLDLVYVIPYGSMGFAFALAYDKTKTIYSPIMMHSFQNTMSFIMLYLASLLGAL